MEASDICKDEIVSRMNTLAARYGVCLGQGAARFLTEEAFSKWINPEDLSRSMPVKAIPIFCAVLKDFSPLLALVEPLGLSLIGPADQERLRWAEAKLKVKELQKIATEAEAKIRKQI